MLQRVRKATARRQQFAREYEELGSQEKVSKKHGLSRERVRQLIGTYDMEIRWWERQRSSQLKGVGALLREWCTVKIGDEWFPVVRGLVQDHGHGELSAAEELAQKIASGQRRSFPDLSFPMYFDTNIQEVDLDALQDPNLLLKMTATVALGEAGLRAGHLIEIFKIIGEK